MLANGSHRLCISTTISNIFLLFALSTASSSAASETQNIATGESGILGTLARGSFLATHAADGSSEKIAEADGGTGNRRLVWQWTFDVVAGSSYALHLTAQATNTKQGMDHYDFFALKGTSEPVRLGQVTNTTMTAYTWPFPDGDYSGELIVQAVDTNQTDDPRRSNQLWIDHIYVLTSGAAPEPLGAPKDLSATAISSTEINIEWTDNATTETGFVIERKNSGDSYGQIAMVDADSETYADSGLTEGNTYYYRVRAYRSTESTDYSDYSNEANATPQNGGSGGGNTGPQTDKVIFGYFPSWAIYNARKYWVRYIPFDHVTHVNYAFANIDPNSLEVVIGDEFSDLTNRKDPETGNGIPAGNLHQLTHYRDNGHNGPAKEHLKILISVGGWTWSENFSDAALTPESRWQFCNSLNNFVRTYNLDGADLNWEFPTGDPASCGESDNICRPEDPVNYALMIMACRLALGPDKLLTTAVPADLSSIAKIVPALVDNNRLTDSEGHPLVIMRNPDDPSELVTIDPADSAVDMLDYIHIMNYDRVGASWEDTTRHHAPLYGYEGEGGDPAAGDPVKSPLIRANAHFSVQALRFIRDDYMGFHPDSPDGGAFIEEIPASKLTLGVPMYGRGFKSVDSGSWDGYEGLFQYTDSSIRRRTPKGTWDGGQWGNSGVYAYWDLLLRHGGDTDDPNHNVWHVRPPSPAKFYGTYLLEGDLFVGFDDRQAITEKMQYVHEEGLGGVMFWDMPGDLSEAQIQAGVPGAQEAHPAKSLIHHISNTLEDLANSP